MNKFGVLLFLTCTLIVPTSSQSQSFEIMSERLDSLIKLGIDSMAFPGAQVLVRHKDSIIYHKSWGFHTYSNVREVKKTDFYDMASITKVTSGLPILMKLYGEGKLNLDAPLKEYYSSLKNSNKKNLSLRKVLAHQGRLQPYIVFWQQAKRKNGKYKCKSFKQTPSKRFSIKITDSLFLHRNYRRKMQNAIKKSPLSSTSKYTYSGLAFLLMPDMISNLVNEPFENFLYQNIYHPIGADNLFYNPLRKIAVEQIIPTEYDSSWRHQLVHGTVHDEAAAMLGGVSCNAGLFGDATSLSALFQLYLNKGMWNNQEIISERAVQVFTSYQYENNRRGLGFDKPLIEYNANQAYVAESASSKSFGHSGFTGTMVWADPEHELIFILLSNRVYPSRDHRNLYSLSLRPKLHQAVYDYILNKEG